MEPSANETDGNSEEAAWHHFNEYGRLHGENEWKSFARFIQTHAHDRDFTPLLYNDAILQAPGEVIKAIIHANPKALFGDISGMTPLGHACQRGASNDVLRVILREMIAYKEKGLSGGKRKRVKEKTSYDGVPFYPFATTGCEQVDFSVQTLGVLLEEYPEGAALPLEPCGSTLLYHTLYRMLADGQKIRFHGKR